MGDGSGAQNAGSRENKMAGNFSFVLRLLALSCQAHMPL